MAKKDYAFLLALTLLCGISPSSLAQGITLNSTPSGSITVHGPTAGSITLPGGTTITLPGGSTAHPTGGGVVNASSGGGALVNTSFGGAVVVNTPFGGAVVNTPFGGGVLNTPSGGGVLNTPFGGGGSVPGVTILSPSSNSLTTAGSLHVAALSSGSFTLISTNTSLAPSIGSAGITAPVPVQNIAPVPTAISVPTMPPQSAPTAPSFTNPNFEKAGFGTVAPSDLIRYSVVINKKAKPRSAALSMVSLGDLLKRPRPTIEVEQP